MAALGSEPKPHAGIVQPKDARQDLGREAGSHRPAVRLAQLARELLAVGERHRRLVLRVEQQAVLGQEPSEQKPMPLLVGALGYEKLSLAAELAPLRAEAVAQQGLVCVKMLRPAIGKHAQPSIAARDALSAARRAASTDVSSCLRR